MRRYLTNVVHNGANILGAIELFIFIGMLFLGNLLGDWSKVVGLVVLVLGIFGPMLFDIFWRVTQAEKSVWNCLFSPFTGGTFIFVPVWLWMFALCGGIGAASVLLKHR